MEKLPVVPYDSKDDSWEDPMVSDPICPFIIPLTIVGAQSAQPGEYGALIDTGYTRCLISQAVVAALGIQVREMAIPIRFEQVDASLLGGAPANHLTKPVWLEMGEHREVLRFIIASKVMESVILSLSWLDKWGPMIWWEGDYRKLRI